MTKHSALALALLAAACGGSKSTTTASNPAETPDTLADRAQTPSERGGTSSEEEMPVIVMDGTIRPGTRMAIVLDEVVGPQFSKEGQMVTASVVPAKREGGLMAFPQGTKVGLSITRVQAAMSGSMGTVTLVPRSIEFNGQKFPIDGRLIAVQFAERTAGGRPVSNTTHDMVGSIVPPKNLTPQELERDILGKGTIISTGNAAPPGNQIDKGTAMTLELRGPVPLALWEGKGDLDLGWIRELLALTESGDGNEFLGKRIELKDAQVQSVIGDVVFWVGPSKDKRVLVVMDQFLDNPELKTVVVQGQTVSVTGVVEAMPPREVAPLLWSMVTDKEAAEFTPHPIYVYATKVSIQKQAAAPAKPAKGAKK
jgi:hypothetical protein